jgi:uncharacterized protein YbaR (Trm112 family)
VDQALSDVLACPGCGDAGGLQAAGGDDPIRCPRCQRSFPRVQGIPCLFADAAARLEDWRRQLATYQRLLAQGAELTEQQLGAYDLLPATRQRLQGLKAAAAENGQRVTALFRSAGITPSEGEPGDAGGEAGFRLIEYYDHLLRDWAWDDETPENARSRDLVCKALGEDRNLGRMVVLGAGGCRLAYDLHMRCKPALTVALDLSPLFLVAAKRVMFGNGLDLYEFPGMPRDAASVCVERQLRAPAGSPERFHLLLADAFTAPLRPGAFDTVLTPWFIDIVPVDVRDTLSLVHRLLTPGGRWINFGPLNYPKDHPHAQRYTREELLTLAALAGFEVGEVEEEEIQLLGSRAAANGRTERIFAFAARKSAAPSAAPGDDPPAWVLFSHLPIPRFRGLDQFRPEHPVMTFLSRAIDGKATLHDLAQRMVKEHGARADSALAGTRALLGLMYQACRPGAA